MLKVGLTGGFATGKSFVAAELARRGCKVVHADELGHRVLAPGGGGYWKTVEAFGPAIVTPEGNIDRRKLGAIVFQDPAQLARLNSVVHPEVYRLEEAEAQAFREQNPDGIFIIEAAILIETGRFRYFDRLIVTECPPEMQIERGMARDNLSREEVLRRLARQMPAEEKRKAANYLIFTGIEKSDTLRQVDHVYSELRRLASEGATAIK